MNPGRTTKIGTSEPVFSPVPVPIPVPLPEPAYAPEREPALVPAGPTDPDDDDYSNGR